jgi:double-stranded uracil-DNA glycosylase
MAPEEKLPDILQPKLRIVFCGTAAGHRSAQLGAYYAGRGNTFWSTLHKMGLTPYQLDPEDFRKVLDFGLGLTDLAKKKSGMDHVLEEDDFDRDGLIEKIKSASPRILAFTSKNAAKQFLQKRKVEYGPQGRIGATELWVLPSTSGAARKHWDITWWQKLAETGPATH